MLCGLWCVLAFVSFSKRREGEGEGERRERGEVEWSGEIV